MCRPLYQEGTSADFIMCYGWSRGFQANQTLDELHWQGFSGYTLLDVINKWDDLDIEMERNIHGDFE